MVLKLDSRSNDDLFIIVNNNYSHDPVRGEQHVCPINMRCNLVLTDIDHFWVSAVNYSSGMKGYHLSRGDWVNLNRTEEKAHRKDS